MLKDTLKVLVESPLLVSRHFAVKEFFASQTADIHHIVNAPPSYEQFVEILTNLHKVSQVLELLRSSTDNMPIIITSGYRNKTLNDMVGGQPYSKHKYGLAVDFRGQSPQHTAKLYESLQWLELGSRVYFYHNENKNYIHLQLSFNPFKSLDTY